MWKKVAAALAVCAGSYGFAGLIDHEDAICNPDVYGKRIERSIIKKSFPELINIFPKGTGRTAAFTSDINKAASGLGIAKPELEKFIKFVLDPQKSPTVKAPHENLLEFEWYALGVRELLMISYYKVPEYWQKILALPVEKRKYTTIPIFHNLGKHGIKLDNEKSFDREKNFLRMTGNYRLGCVDSQGCILAELNAVVRCPQEGCENCANEPRTPEQRASDYRMLFRKRYINGDFLVQEYSKNASAAVDTKSVFHNGWDYASDIDWALLNDKEENLRAMCSADPVMRDLIICFGLTNREMKRARNAAWEFYRKSTVNYPAAAVKLHVDAAVELLKDHPEYHALMDQLLIRKKYTGMEKIQAVDRYIAKYPDYDSSDENSGVFYLNSHAELHALAGLELYKMSRPYEAAERWVKGCIIEDMALVAEQIMTVEELEKFCQKHFAVPVAHEQMIYSGNCSRDNSGYGAKVATPEQLNFMMRNLLARRLMRTGNYDKARRYFTGDVTRTFSERYFVLQEKLNSPGIAREEKLCTALNIAALVRFHGDRLFGTFLEPDNLICGNRFPCVWGGKHQYVKLNKPDLPRYSYRHRAAELYARATELSDDYTVKGRCLWTAANLLRFLSPEKADVYNKKLRIIAPELCNEEWLKLEKNVPFEVQEFDYRSFFTTGKIFDASPLAPLDIPETVLPEELDKNNADALFNYAVKHIRKSVYSRNSVDLIRKSRYALKKARELGRADADLILGMIQYRLCGDFEGALWYLKRAEKYLPEEMRVKNELGFVYASLGFWKEGIGMVKYIADREMENKKIRGEAALKRAKLYFRGIQGIPADLAEAEHYLNIASKCGNSDAEDLRWEINRKKEKLAEKNKKENEK